MGQNNSYGRLEEPKEHSQYYRSSQLRQNPTFSNNSTNSNNQCNTNSSSQPTQDYPSWTYNSNKSTNRNNSWKLNNDIKERLIDDKKTK